MARIDLTDVSLTFSIRRAVRLSLKEYLLNGMFLNAKNPKVNVHALSHVDLAAGDGDRVGVIGHNGAGKSTLLKLLAGVYTPTGGTRRVAGRISSLFDITLGFEPDASGRDNIRYRSYLQGETPRTLAGKIDYIEQFAELGDFLDLPVRYYSAGMMVRLAFAIATASDPEVLLVDEVLAVGDHGFQVKAQQRMKEMMATAKLMVMVSHDMRSISNMCDRVLWLEHGTVRMSGPTAAVVAAYMASVGAPPLAAAA